MIEQEVTAALGRGRYERGAAAGYRNGTRTRRLLGSFGLVEIAVSRARPSAADGSSHEWQSAVLPRYARMTRQVEALVASAYLSGTNTRRVKRALGALFKGAIGKDVVSRVWRKLKTDRGARKLCDLAGEDVVRHGGAGAARLQGHQHLTAGRPRRSRQWTEGSVGGT